MVSAKDILIPNLPKDSKLYEQVACKEEFLMTGKDAVHTKDFALIHSYFDSHSNFKPLHCLFIRKVY